MAGTTLGGLAPGDHVCVLHGGLVGRSGVLEAFILPALDSGDKVICRIARVAPAVVAEALEAADGRAREALRSGQFVITGARESYLPSGAFDPERVIDAWREELDRIREDGYPGMRVVGDMSWAADPVPGTERLAWYEAEVNRVFVAGFACVVCLYDRSTFSPARLRQYIQAHPGTIEPGVPRIPQLRLRYTSDPRGLAIAGEADIANRTALAAVLAGLPHDAPGDGPLTIDVSGLTFADVGTAAALLRCTREIPQLRLTGLSPYLSDLLDMVAQAT
ncbi:MEDS domain-containing protein [Dactylosporangium sp. NPDC000555]|uniref:MEDS domain-containing protein n=1 Tax=Dactylosporangium sp. NPDC000555 TaxID=3154260 RepID=UPI00332B9750